MRQTELKVGCFVLLAMGVAGAALLWLGWARVFQPVFTFDILFREAPGVEEDAPVRLAGVEIGRVAEVDVDRQGDTIVARVRAEVDPEPGQLLRTGYRYTIAGGTLIGTRYIEIRTTDPEGHPITEAGERMARRSPEGIPQVWGEDPITLEEVFFKLNAISSQVSQTLAENAGQVGKAVGVLSRTLVEKEGKIQAMLDNAATASAAISRMAVSNQGHVENMLANLSAASGRFNRLLGASQPDLQRLVRNMATTTAALERIVTGSETNAKQLVRDLRQTVGGLQRILSQNEENFQTVAENLAAVSQGARRWMEENRTHFATLTQNMAELSTSTRTLVTEHQEEISGLLQNVAATAETLRQTVGQAQEPLEETIRNVASLTAHLDQLLADNSEQARQLMVHLPQLSQEAAEATAAINRFLTEEKALDNLAATLDSLRQATQELPALVQGLRGLLTDEEVQTDLRQTLAHLEEATGEATLALQRVNRVLGRGSGDRKKPLGWQVDFRYQPERARYRTDVNVVWPTRPGYFWRIGAENASESERLNLQYGSPWGPQARWRYGLYRSKLGVGLDYRAPGGPELALDLFDPNDWHFNVQGLYRLHRSWQLNVGVEQIGRENDFIFGLRYAPEINY